MEYDNYNENIQEVLKKLGLLCFKQLGWNKLTEHEIILKMNNNNDTLTEIINDKNDELYILTNENKNIKQGKQKEINDIKLELENKFSEEFLQKINFEKEKIRNEEINEKNNTTNLIQNLNEKIYHLEETLQKEEEHSSLLSKIVDKKNFTNPTEQGDYAEKLLDDIIHEGLHFDDKTTIEDTSGCGGSGDRIITFPKYDLRLMIEMKNKGKIKKDDIDQFTDHYQKDFTENKTDVALFISYRTDHIISKGRCVVPTFYENNKVCYFGMNDEWVSEQKKKLIVNTLEIICKNYKKDTIIEENNDNKNIYESFIKKLKEDKSFLTSEKKTYEKYLKVIDTKISENEKEYNTLLREITTKNIIINNTLLDDKKITEILIHDIKKYVKEKNFELNDKNWKNDICSAMNLSEYQIKILKNKNKKITKNSILNNLCNI
jgi:hypothetical protein